jgi:hypothetical protein
MHISGITYLNLFSKMFMFINVVVDVLGIAFI